MHHVKKLVTAVLTAALLVAGGSAARAEDTVGDDLDPQLVAYLETLTPAEREQFLATLLPATVDVVVGAQVPTDGAAVSSLLTARLTGLRVSPLATGCWSQRWTWAPKAAAGNTLYTYYHVGSWCSSGSSVTSARIADYGGETSTPGWDYEGVIASGKGVVSNEGRSYSKHKFELRVGSWVVQTATPCGRVKGRSSGSSTADATCGIY
ncbi:hypothetical protein CWIS_12485 [Cellulomonas sp. A375-1]|uniref:Secreted protein n=1 Tax=Cellulomonas gelida TaxID=1712 RepID=A0A4Y3KPA0_9CELL|nr:MULTISPECIES: hypothetical protein [Cellulomonas]KMM45115.1 hypothetical protein CWIS_12485 [Cellulomonas sp. A375-1]MCR6705713.1 hypothetical protein [Cellulomonas sp.]GEA84770.1 hypothetical protein CGE01nite_20210 [Cellulomonas gelida]GGL15677.1 hypothetical protein GCM10009774_02630 [Cellulomonas gelida]